MASIPKIHLRKCKIKTWCGRAVRLLHIRHKPNNVTCKKCLDLYTQELKDSGFAKLYVEKKENPLPERNCLMCDKRFAPKSRFNFNCGCLKYKDMGYEDDPHNILCFK